ncbi:DHH family phosphoesterase [Methylomonas sp. EFPC3]|uniref:DHH family phosphoesterase n=1 Tax=Methylomonas sp. EFPC3 TaxID=3021710 RepID=UPI0024180563|nr:DHH family phosphoesterase [Methylomonas sp. EFPC3]WFP50743.1 DHH family phosphoesterase [Methylomonas sp. EFPC3]
MNIDVFNGDADGICSLIQLRLAYPLESRLVTGVKRDIGLLNRVVATRGDDVVVLDVSLDRNRAPLLGLLAEGVRIFYMDHHYSGEIPGNPYLTAWIDTDANVCTSLLMDRYLGSRYTAWAIAGAFGDNLRGAACELAKQLNISARELHDLEQLGVCVNYNGYGNDISDLHMAPDLLYQELKNYCSPLTFISEKFELYRQLCDGYFSDLNLANDADVEYVTSKVAVYVLPNEKWARRVSGVWANALTNQYPDRAHAVLTLNGVGGYQVSLRAPLVNKWGADLVCAQFGGGGRKAAAGIDNLPGNELKRFVDVMVNQFL